MEESLLLQNCVEKKGKHLNFEVMKSATTAPSDTKFFQILDVDH